MLGYVAHFAVTFDYILSTVNKDIILFSTYLMYHAYVTSICMHDYYVYIIGCPLKIIESTCLISYRTHYKISSEV